MAKKFSFATYDSKHLKNLLRRAMDISSLFSDAAREGARIGEATGYADPNGEFAFDKFPAVKQRVEELFKGLHDSLVLAVTDGNREEWLLSVAKNDALVESKYSRAVKKFADRAKAWTDPHLEALEQFNKRKERGMSLSDRVWRLTDQFKGELELALEMGLGDGKSAASLSRDVRQYLNEPHKLFRRVRDEKGQLRLSKAAAAYHPGQGVYRSSYKNALRLTVTENNMAYRTADHERWNDLDFVIGIEIMLSNNHPVEDICDGVCGVYPKTFKFVGWHPFCRCIAVPKLADEDEFISRQQALIDGEDVPQGGYAGEVTEMPECFTDWVQENAERIETAKSQPYFIRDNRAAMQKALEAGATTKPVPSLYTEQYLKDMQRGGIMFHSGELLVERMENSPFNQLDIVKLDNDIRSLMTRFGYNDFDISGRMQADANGNVLAEWSDWNNTFKLTRKLFIDSEGRKVVDHHLFELDKALQGKGISKRIFQSLYEQYKATGIERMEVFANIDVGGYTWARYGFCVKSRDEVISAIRFSALTAKQEKRIMAIVDEHFETSNEPFPMNKIAKLPYGKRALLGQCWDGFLDLTNAKQRSVFESYLRR